MCNAMIRVFYRVFKRRIDNGESFDDVAKSYTKLSDDDVTKIKAYFV